MQNPKIDEAACRVTRKLANAATSTRKLAIAALILLLLGAAGCPLLMVGSLGYEGYEYDKTGHLPGMPPQPSSSATPASGGN